MIELMNVLGVGFWISLLAVAWCAAGWLAHRFRERQRQRWLLTSQSYYSNRYVWPSTNSKWIEIEQARRRMIEHLAEIERKSA